MQGRVIWIDSFHAVPPAASKAAADDDPVKDAGLKKMLDFVAGKTGDPFGFGRKPTLDRQNRFDVLFDDQNGHGTPLVFLAFGLTSLLSV